MTVPDSPGGGGPGHLFPALATDSAGTVYTAWIDTTDNNVYYSYSTDQGTSWTTPAKVSTAPSSTAEFLWAQAGRRARWRSAGTRPTRLASPTRSRTGPTTRKARPRSSGTATRADHQRGLPPADGRPAALHGEADALRPDLQPGHRLHGLERRPDDGRLFAVNFDQRARCGSFTTTRRASNTAPLYEVRQLQGKTFNGKAVKEAVPKSPMEDVAGDAQWPHYSPTGPGLNQPQLDFTNLALSQPSPSMLRVKMTLANLNGLQPPPGKTSAVWLTRFQALSVGDFGEEAYRIFYVGAESTAGLWRRSTSPARPRAPIRLRRTARSRSTRGQWRRRAGSVGTRSP